MSTLLAQAKVMRRNGSITAFDSEKIKVAMQKAFVAVKGEEAKHSVAIRETLELLVEQVVTALAGRYTGTPLHIESIQDQVELALMRTGEHEVARAYVLYREERAKLRKQHEAELEQEILSQEKINVVRDRLIEACRGLEKDVDLSLLIRLTEGDLYPGATSEEIEKATIFAARALIERDPAYNTVTMRLLLAQLYREILGAYQIETLIQQHMDYFPVYLQKGVEADLLNPELLTFDLVAIAQALRPDRDDQFTYLGLQTIYDRYLLHIDDQRIETPQIFFMRVAMGLAIREENKTARAIEFYEVLSKFDLMTSTPTLFNSGTSHSQLSSCYLTTVGDDLDQIYEAIKENALLSKWAGGIGNDWTAVRALGARIKGTNGKSQGIVPFLKVVNDTCVAVNQCFDGETGVYTQVGIKPIKDIKIGDLVLTSEGSYRPVTEHFQYIQQEAMLEIKVKQAFLPLKVTDAHPFYALCGVPKASSHQDLIKKIATKQLKPKWVEAKALTVGDYIAQVIPQEVRPVAYLTAEDARFYGLFLANGMISGSRFVLNIETPESMEFALTYLQKYNMIVALDKHQLSWQETSLFAQEGTAGTFISHNQSALPFSFGDFYNQNGKKAFAARLMHLPRAQTIQLVRGLLENIQARSEKMLPFVAHSLELAENVRYQCLRLGIPTTGKNTQTEWTIRVPLVAEIATALGRPALQKRTWVTLGNKIYTQIKTIQPVAKSPVVHDLKVENIHSYQTVAGLAHNGGKRKGSACVYLETWHLDIEEFLELRKNTGDDRRRTHDMNTANWVPDLFMKRVMENAEWTLFSPQEVPDLHEKYGQAFEEAYGAYEAKAQRGQLKQYKVVSAVALWRKMLTMLFETGHPWITFKDPCNIRSPQQHIGVVHSSNLCTEITLNTNEEEIAVCNLSSINLVNHLKDGQLDYEKIQQTITTGMRMLDNVIDINFYPVEKARRSNLKHRPVGLGVMGFQDCLYQLGISYASEDAIRFADRSQEAIAYYAYLASTKLAEERGTYETFKGSLWDQGILPQDSQKRLHQERGARYFDINDDSHLDWTPVRERIRQYGMRNSNCLAIAPTATIANIIGVSASIEPTFQNLYAKANLSGDFIVLNQYLVQDLKKLNSWNKTVLDDIKYFDGSIQRLDYLPEAIRQKYLTAFEIDTSWLIECAARRQKWIDQSQSLNLYIVGSSGKKLDETYKLAWQKGLKTTYYLRSMGATHVEKSTVKAGSLNAVQAYTPPAETGNIKVCLLDDPTCESCQ